MQKQRFYYLIYVQFLGFRYSGWQKQPGQKTIEHMLLKTLKFIVPNQSVKILGAGRTDAKVSALQAAFELFVDQPIASAEDFLKLFNKNLPPDIRVTEMQTVDANFNIIQHSKTKEYCYLFSFGAKNHPFAAPYIVAILDALDIELMQKGARYFEGTHDFSVYTARKQEHTKTIRTIEQCEIRTNDLIQANFFPKKSYLLSVKGQGFMRYQIRMIMGALLQLGKGELSLTEIENSLKSDSKMQLSYVAPGSGLILNSLEFKKTESWSLGRP